MAVVPATAFLLPIALSITLVRVIVLADTLQRSKGKFVSVERGVSNVAHAATKKSTKYCMLYLIVLVKIAFLEKISRICYNKLRITFKKKHIILPTY